MSEVITVARNTPQEIREHVSAHERLRDTLQDLVNRCIVIIPRNELGRSNTDLAIAVGAVGLIAVLVIGTNALFPLIPRGTPSTPTPPIVRSLNIEATATTVAVAASAPATTRVRPPTSTPKPTRTPEQELEYLKAYFSTLVQPDTHITIETITPSISIPIPGPLGIDVYGGPYAGISIGAIAPRGGVNQSPLGWSVKVGEDKWIVWSIASLRGSNLSVNISPGAPPYAWARVP